MTGRCNYLLIDGSLNELHRHADVAVALAGDVSIRSSNWRAGMIQERCAAGNLVWEITECQGIDVLQIAAGRLGKARQIPEEIEHESKSLDGTEKATQKATKMWLCRES
jgi:hypothetical protein